MLFLPQDEDRDDLVKIRIDRKNPLRPLVHFYVDEGSHSCGESRSDWKLIHTCSLEEFLRSAYYTGVGKLTEYYL